MEGRLSIQPTRSKFLELFFRLAAEQYSALTNPRLSGWKDRVCYGRCIMLAVTYDGAVVGVVLSGHCTSTIGILALRGLNTELGAS